jgi:CheY-like chemotaxis protein
MVAARAGTGAGRPGRGSAVPQPNPYVLVVDDEPDSTETMVMLLGAHGIPAVKAANGREALEAVRSHPPPAVVVLDLRMPVMGGEQFLAERRADPALSAIPVVVFSATADPATQERLTGVAAFLQKPADPGELVAAVRRYLPG